MGAPAPNPAHPRAAGHPARDVRPEADLIVDPTGDGTERWVCRPSAAFERWIPPLRGNERRLQATDTLHFFDTGDGGRRFRDNAGIDLAGPHDVPGEAPGLLRDLARSHLPVGRHELTVEVRNAVGTPVYRGAMTIMGRVVA